MNTTSATAAATFERAIAMAIALDDYTRADSVLIGAVKLLLTDDYEMHHVAHMFLSSFAAEHDLDVARLIEMINAARIAS